MMLGAQVLVVGGQPVTMGLALAMAAISAGFLFLGVGLGRGSLFGKGKGSPSARSASDDAFVKGVAHLMADHTDQAIEEFTRAVNLNSDTVETYQVLGNLFRQKGEIDRAVRLRQTIIARPNLDPAIRLQALYDLGLDYKKGGLFNRAVECLEDVLRSEPQHVPAWRTIVDLYESTRDWEKAFQALKRLDKLTREDSRAILAHYKTERGKELMAQGVLDQAEDALHQALAVDKGCLDAYLHLGDLELARGRNKKALAAWKKAVNLAPVHTHLVLNRLDQAEETLGRPAVEAFFGNIKPDEATVFTLLALARNYRRHEQDDKALELLSLAVHKEPSQLQAHRLRGEILLASGDAAQLRDAFASLLAVINGREGQFQCSQCGFLSHQLTWKCPRCLGWDTMLPQKS
ncbi:MAG: tetratricopeptide repeat protein [Deltaproteobacteria bacterium]|nr:tetratricopeptide repeat protein [Deltaproteobacteria bacterium]